MSRSYKPRERIGFGSFAEVLLLAKRFKREQSNKEKDRQTGDVDIWINFDGHKAHAADTTKLFTSRSAES